MTLRNENRTGWYESLMTTKARYALIWTVVGAVVLALAITITLGVRGENEKDAERREAIQRMCQSSLRAQTGSPTISELEWEGSVVLRGVNGLEGTHYRFECRGGEITELTTIPTR